MPVTKAWRVRRKSRRPGDLGRSGEALQAQGAAENRLERSREIWATVHVIKNCSFIGRRAIKPGKEHSTAVHAVLVRQDGSGQAIYDH